MIECAVLNQRVIHHIFAVPDKIVWKWQKERERRPNVKVASTLCQARTRLPNIPALG